MRVAEASITSIVRAIEYIEQNLQEELTIAEIAEAACYSLYHFCRLFNSVTHHTPYEYLMRRRLSEAARELIGTDKKVIEIAFDYEFNNPETFTRAFKRMFGMQPNQWRKQGHIHTRLLMPPLTPTYLRHLNQDDSLKPVLIEKQAFEVVGLMILVQQELSLIPEIWRLLRQERDRTDSSTHPEMYYGIVWYPENWKIDGFLYMAGWESKLEKVNHPAFVLKTIPTLRYIRVLHKGCWQDRHLSLEYLYHTWLPKSDKRLAYPLEIEVYGQKNPGFDQEEFGLLLPVE